MIVVNCGPIGALDMRCNTHILNGLAVMLLGGGVAQAELTVQANGTVYDSEQEIFWDQDGRAVKTLCTSPADPIWMSFDLDAVAGNTGRTKVEICDEDGRMNWYEAEAWVAHLNVRNYKGSSNWRQWSVTQPDASCSHRHLTGADYGYHCTGSELGSLYAAPPPVGLGNPNDLEGGCSPNCMENAGPFVNLDIGRAYWSGTISQLNPGYPAWYFDVANGFQDAGLGSSHANQLLVWAVRPGQVAPPQPIPTVSVWGLGLLGLLVAGLVRMRLR